MTGRGVPQPSVGSLKPRFPGSPPQPARVGGVATMRGCKTRVHARESDIAANPVLDDLSQPVWLQDCGIAPGTLRQATRRCTQHPPQPRRAKWDSESACF